MSFLPAGSLAAAFAPLRSAYGSRLSVHRNGNAVRWTLDGRTTIVEPGNDGVLQVAFIACETRDSVYSSALAPLYRTETAYRMTTSGAAHLATDMAAFFAGTREPRFQFAGFQEREPVRS